MGVAGLTLFVFLASVLFRFNRKGAPVLEPISEVEPDALTVVAPWEFRVSDQDLGQEATTDIAFGDLDNDNDVDAVVSTSDRVLIWRNDGSGRYHVEQLELNSAWDSVDVGDVDNDGHLDAVLASGNGPLRFLHNDGNGQLVIAEQELDVASSTQARLCDLDGDGDLDLFVATIGLNTVWRNDGSGHFVQTSQLFVDSHSMDVQLADLDGDFDIDAFVVNRGADRVWTNNGDGDFSDSGQLIGELASNGVALGDLDGDGDIDAVVSTIFEQVDQIWLNDGKGNFSAGETLGEASVSPDVAVADIDQDGDCDVIIANWFDEANGRIDPTQLWLNDGSAQFTRSLPLSSGVLLTATVAVNDVNGDGRLDVVLGNWGQQRDVLLIGEPPK